MEDSPLWGPLKGIDNYVPVVMKFPAEGRWRLDISIGNRPVGQAVVDVGREIEPSQVIGNPPPLVEADVAVKEYYNALSEWIMKRRGACSIRPFTKTRPAH
ncbi:hypothetical protein skT53_21720 [Effusibacillus dendaii]|uniref:Uncharacterized protein n=1 Tax=Effusibacillus dendaii TaxID=2743772 RepID=A0A7I8DB08_9BACL|nr:hypothetical protein skT53_21720 [Effusibacillus dendaii]